ncbi:MAG: ribonuclease Y [Chloroherpetonaceae bacterium]|nr:ribonuclease Y [Chloroherpetonaceae bacterium]MDW8438299.1 ribonuclease Y [Chloroherpetonaceae bacterium]
MDIAINFALLIVASALFFVVGFFVGRFLLDRVGTTKLLEAEERAAQIIQEAQREADAQKAAKLEEVNEEWKRKKREFDQESERQKQALLQQQKQLKSREEALTRRIEQTQKREKALAELQKELTQKQNQLAQRAAELEQLVAAQNARLEALSGMNAEDAKAMLMENMLAQAKADAAAQLQAIETETKEKAQRIAERIVLSAIERTSLDQAAENAITTIHLQSDELKGRIIGREGRNIKAFENITGVDLIVDDTPEVVILSCFDPIRRELAKITLQRLLVDGVIHPGTIEKSYQLAEKELEEIIVSAGEEAVTQLGIANLHPDLIRMIGKMKFRSNYGQNLLKHSKEVAMLAGLMAAELKLDAKLAKRAGLLHDIGKMLDLPDASHSVAGAELLKKYKEHPVVVNAVLAHHGDAPKESPIADLVDAANVISGARPGARGAITPEGYIKRLESLEEIAKQFPGVAKTYAMQAGREIRVIVEGDKVPEGQTELLARDIAKKINESVQYPGQIKITVVRETRAVAYAR